jgi:hypothetical protein
MRFPIVNTDYGASLDQSCRQCHGPLRTTNKCDGEVRLSNGEYSLTLNFRELADAFLQGKTGHDANRDAAWRAQ